jgi:hypothetical protein
LFQGILFGYSPVSQRRIRPWFGPSQDCSASTTCSCRSSPSNISS